MSEEAPVTRAAQETPPAEAPARTLRFRPGRPLHLGQTLGTLRRGAGDPTWATDHRGLWRAMRSPAGPVTVLIRTSTSGGPHGSVAVAAWGSAAAADWAVRQAPTMLGEGDDPTGFVPEHPRVRSALATRPGWRVPRTGLVLEALIPAVIEQKVTGQEAFGGYRRLVRRFGTPAPGCRTVAPFGLMVPPSVQRMRALPSWEWLRLGISPQRADTLARVLRQAATLEALADLPLPLARRRLVTIQGVGVWTAAETCQRALGDADAVSFGDYHVAKNLSWALTGTEGDDETMAALLTPYAPHRYRVQRLLELDGAMRPRRGPRMAPRAHLPIGG